ncbi:MAG: CaiB/BaiF CoA transferase family protein [Candidatus Tectimicrobiota bacterium]
MQRPLEGYRVIDLGQIYNGPYCSLLMAFLGAEVIKVEPLQGETVRQRDPVSRMPHPYLMLNSNKKSVTLNLKHPQGKALLRDLVARGDVVLENFAVGVMERLGFGYETLKTINPRIIYASSSGYGRGGPYAHYSAMDLTVQAVAGVMAITGYPDDPPVKAGPAMSDFIAGIHLYAAVVTALLRRERTGEGCMVEVAMHDAIYPTLTSNLGAYYDKGTVVARTANRHGGLAIAPYNTYPTSDGWMAIFCASESHWPLLCDIMGRADLRADPRFTTNALRARHMEAVDALVSAWTRQFTRQDLTELLTRAGMPCGPVLSLDEVADDPNLKHRQMIVELDHPAKGRVKVIGCPLKFFTTDGALDIEVFPAPYVGQHTDEVYTSLLGYTPADLERWRAEGVL